MNDLVIKPFSIEYNVFVFFRWCYVANFHPLFVHILLTADLYRLMSSPSHRGMTGTILNFVNVQTDKQSYCTSTYKNIKITTPFLEAFEGHEFFS